MFTLRRFVSYLKLKGRPELIGGAVIVTVAMSAVALAYGSGATKGRAVSQNPRECASCSQSSGSSTAAPPEDSQFTNKTVITIAVNPAGGAPKYRSPLGKELQPSELQKLVRALPKDNHSAIYFKPFVAPTPGNALRPDWEYINQIGCYWFRISWEKHYVGGCVHRDAWHLGFLVRNNCNHPTTMMFDGHACVWWENGPQFGLYNSASGWCRTSRGGFTAIRDVFYAGLTGVGIAWWLAYPVADISAGLTVACFGL